MTRKGIFVARAMDAKMKCLWKPAQSGKTRTIQELIRDDDGMKSALNIVICSNNRLLVAQTNARMSTDLYDESASVEEDGPADDAIVGGVYSWMSGTKKSNIDVDALAWKIMRNKVSMIVCCAHKARFLHLHRLLQELQEANYSKPVNVWIDEADVSVKHWSGEFDFSKFSVVREITLVSATFGAVLDVYTRIRVMPFPETHPECYLGLEDCDTKEFDAEVHGAGAYVDAVLTAHPEMVVPGAKLFVPGDIERVTHNAIAEYLMERGCIVLVLNGETKAFLFPDGTRVDVDMTLDEENPTELSQVVAEMYETHDMKRFPFVVTGHLCLGRGITFQSKSFTFDYAIIPGMKDAATAYQCVARVLGNVRRFSPWTPTVYMNSRLLAAVLRQERIAKNLARLVHANEWVDVGVDEIAAAAATAPAHVALAATDSHLEEFDDMDALSARWCEILTAAGKPLPKTKLHKPHVKDGVYICSLGDKSDRQESNAIRGKFSGRSIANWGVGITKAEPGEYVHRVYAGYNADGSVVFFLRWAQKAEGVRDSRGGGGGPN